MDIAALQHNSGSFVCLFFVCVRRPLAFVYTLCALRLAFFSVQLKFASFLYGYFVKSSSALIAPGQDMN